MLAVGALALAVRLAVLPFATSDGGDSAYRIWIAADWLAHKARAIGGEADEYLNAAADQYRKLTAGCMQDIDCPWSLCPGPEKYDDWTSDMRQKQMTRLDAAREHDRYAIGELSKALKALE